MAIDNSTKFGVVKTTKDKITSSNMAEGKLYVALDNSLGGGGIYLKNDSSIYNVGIGNAYTKNESDNRYLPLSGGTITDMLTLSNGRDTKLIFNNTDGEKYTNISFTESGTEYAQMRVSKEEFAIYHNTGILKMNGNTVLHASNYADYTYSKTNVDDKLATKLNLSGGTLTGPLAVKNAAWHNRMSEGNYAIKYDDTLPSDAAKGLLLIDSSNNLKWHIAGVLLRQNKDIAYTYYGGAAYNDAALYLYSSKNAEFKGTVTAPTFIGNLIGTADKSTYSDTLITNSRNFTAANDRLNVKSGVRFYANIYNNSGIAGDWGFPSGPNNSNGVLVLQVDTVDSEPLNGRTSHILGLSGNGNIYHKHKNNDSTSWYEIVEAKGTSSQFIKGDGTLDSTEYATKEDVKDSGTYWEYL